MRYISIDLHGRQMEEKSQRLYNVFQNQKNLIVLLLSLIFHQ